MPTLAQEMNSTAVRDCNCRWLYNILTFHSKIFCSCETPQCAVSMGCKSFFGAFGLWAERDLNCATPVGTKRLMFSVSSKGPTHLFAFYVISKVHRGTTLTRVSTRVAFLNVETLVIMLDGKVWLVHINVTWQCYLNNLYLFILLTITPRPPLLRCGVAFALYAEIGVRSSVGTRIGSVVTAPLPNTRHQVWVSWVLSHDHYKGLVRVTVGVEH